MRELRPLRAVAAAASVLVLVAACSGAASPSPSAAPSAAASSAPSAAASGSASGSGGSYQLAIASGSVGRFLTGEDGKTLYIFKKDTVGATSSACTGQCATNWPAFELEGNETVTAGTGVTGTIATIAAADGNKQVTYNGMPLYYYAADKAAGDTNGQGVGNVWFVAAP